MIKKNYNKYTSFIDRFPFIIVAFIAVLAIVFIFHLKAKLPTPFFSVNTYPAQSIAYSSYPILVATPYDEEVFDFLSKNMYVPIEIKSKAIEGLDYKLYLNLTRGIPNYTLTATATNSAGQATNSINLS